MKLALKLYRVTDYLEGSKLYIDHLRLNTIQLSRLHHFTYKYPQAVQFQYYYFNNAYCLECQNMVPIQYKIMEIITTQHGMLKRIQGATNY